MKHVDKIFCVHWRTHTIRVHPYAQRLWFQCEDVWACLGGKQSYMRMFDHLQKGYEWHDFDITRPDGAPSYIHSLNTEGVAHLSSKMAGSASRDLYTYANQLTTLILLSHVCAFPEIVLDLSAPD